MALRWFIGILCISFCAVMTVLLLRVTYFPETSRLASESPELVMERFLSRRHAPSDLDIWKGNEIIGRLVLEPKELITAEQRRLGAIAYLHVDGVVSMEFPGIPKGSLTLIGDLFMGLDGEVRESTITLGLTQQNLYLKIIQKHLVPEPRFVLRQGDLEIFDSSKSDASEPSQKMVDLLLGSIQMDPKARAREASKAAESITEARRGKFNVLGRDFTGYHLTTTLGGGGDRKFILAITDSGEVMQMLTNFLDYRFISADLRPDGMNGYLLESVKKLNLPGPPPSPPNK